MLNFKYNYYYSFSFDFCWVLKQNKTFSKTTKRWFRKKAPFLSTITPTWDNLSTSSSTWIKTTPPTWNTWRGGWKTLKSFTGTTWRLGTASFAWNWRNRRTKRGLSSRTEEGNYPQVKLSSRWTNGFTMKRVKSVCYDLVLKWLNVLKWFSICFNTSCWMLLFVKKNQITVLKN